MSEKRVVPGASGYAVDTNGLVWTRWRKGPGSRLGNWREWRELAPMLDREGYRRIELTTDAGRKITRKVCGLVLTAFRGTRPEGMECRHLNGICDDDRLDNLAWGTPLENHADKRSHGTIATGERHGKTKLTESQIAELLSLNGTTTQVDAASRFGVSRGYVGQLWSGARKRVAT